VLGSSPLDAFERIASRAQDVNDLYRPGGVARNADVRIAPLVVPSSDPLSVAAPPGAWFVTRGPDGARAYTRDGSLHVRDGVLRSAEGADVLGYPGGDARGALPVPLRLPETDRALGRGGDVRVEGDGTLAYTRAAFDPRTGERGVERVVVGRVALARFPAGTQPARIDAVRVSAPHGVVPHLGTPNDGTFPRLATYSRDAGTVDIDAGVERLNEAYRAFQAMGAAVRSRASMDKTTTDLVK
jgi:flagellar basal body rod protein FlgG